MRHWNNSKYRVVGIFLAACVLAACETDESVPENGLVLDGLDSPATADSLAPRLAELDDERVLLSWLEVIEDGHALRFSILEDREWSSPRSVIEGDDWFANWADTPGIMAVGDHLFAHWLVSSGEGSFEYDIYAAWSDDEGESWSEPFTVHLDGKQAEHGFLSGVELPDGALGLAWLDGRHMVAEPPGPMSLRWARFEPGSTEPGDKTELDDRVCDCCMTASVRTDEGNVVIYRDRDEDELRDISTVSVDGSVVSEPRNLHEDGWRIPGCPVNGPSADFREGTALTAWFTAADQDPAVRLASLDGQGQARWSERIDDGAPIGRTATAVLPDGDGLVLWIEQEDGGGSLVARRVAGPDELSAVSRLTDIDPGRGSGFPVVAMAGEAVVVAWTDTEEGGRQVRTALLELN